MVHHVGIEVREGDVERAVELFELLGFELVDVPPSLGERYTWLEREGTQIHLMHEENPVAAPRGHLAVVAPDFEATVEALGRHGFELQPGRPHWGVPRTIAIAPGGHRIELMQAPPPRRLP
jgi:catechol 2,3-dioxygenase-like lactoylglutathione lyase family enzyme